MRKIISGPGRPDSFNLLSKVNDQFKHFSATTTRKELLQLTSVIASISTIGTSIAKETVEKKGILSKKILRKKTTNEIDSNLQCWIEATWLLFGTLTQITYSLPNVTQTSLPKKFQIVAKCCTAAIQHWRVGKNKFWIRKSAGRKTL